MSVDEHCHCLAPHFRQTVHRIIDVIFFVYGVDAFNCLIAHAIRGRFTELVNSEQLLLPACHVQKSIVHDCPHPVLEVLVASVFVSVYQNLQCSFLHKIIRSVVILCEIVCISPQLPVNSQKLFFDVYFFHVLYSSARQINNRKARFVLFLCYFLLL